MRTVKGLVFDFGGTLDIPGEHWLFRFARHYYANGLRLPVEILRPAFDYATAQAYRLGPVPSGLELEALVKWLISLQFEFLSQHVAPGLDLQFDSARLTRIACAFTNETLAGMRRACRTLEQLSRRFRLAIASNFYGNLVSVLGEGGIRDFFEVIGDSSCVGVFKPDKGLLSHVLDAMGLAPEQAAMIGDSVERDCLPARELGMYTIWIRANTVDTLVCEPVEVDRTILALEELVDLPW